MSHPISLDRKTVIVRKHKLKLRNTTWEFIHDSDYRKDVLYCNSGTIYWLLFADLDKGIVQPRNGYEEHSSICEVEDLPTLVRLSVKGYAK